MKNPAEFLELFGPMIEQIKNQVLLHAVVLFGSRARGDSHKYSDYDLLIIADFKEPFRKLWDWVVRLIPYVSIDLFCLTPGEFDRLFGDFNLTAIDSIGEGIALFGAEFLAPYKIKYDDEFVQKGMKKTSCILVHPVP